jgi:hypothetical protein
MGGPTRHSVALFMAAEAADCEITTTNQETSIMSTTAPFPAPATATAPTAGQQGIQVAPSSPLSISSLVLGLVSIFAGWTFFAPIAGLVTGIMALSREPHSRTMAIWGIVINAVMLGGMIIVVLVMIVAGLAALPFLPLAFL